MDGSNEKEDDDVISALRDVLKVFGTILGLYLWTLVMTLGPLYYPLTYFSQRAFPKRRQQWTLAGFIYGAAFGAVVTLGLLNIIFLTQNYVKFWLYLYPLVYIKPHFLRPVLLAVLLDVLSHPGWQMPVSGRFAFSVCWVLKYLWHASESVVTLWRHSSWSKAYRGLQHRTPWDESVEIGFLAYYIFCQACRIQWEGGYLEYKITHMLNAGGPVPRRTPDRVEKK